MKRSLRKKWVAALRSRKYRQGTNTLRSGPSGFDGRGAETYCCLGVLCEVMKLPKVKGGGWNDFGYQLGPRKRDMAFTEFSASFLRTIGLTNEQQRTLIEMNDDERKKFGAIARWIETHIRATP